MQARRIGLLMACVLSLLASGSAEAKKMPAPTRAAVLYFDYEGKDVELGFLRKGLTELLVADLGDVAGLEIVERVQLEQVFQELDRRKDRRFDRRSTAQIGKLLGARYLITGRYFTLGKRLTIVAKVIDVQLGVTKAVKATLPTKDFGLLEQQLAEKLRAKIREIRGDSAKTQPTKLRRRKSRPRKLKTRTAARYGRALDAIDRGDKKSAKKILGKVVKEAPKFRLATRDLAALVR